MRSRALIPTTVAAIALVALGSATAQGPPVIVVFDRQPLVVYEVSHQSIFGTTHEHLIAYSDGHVSYSLRGDGVSPDVSAFVELAPLDTHALGRTPRAEGVLKLGDSVTPGQPAATLTVLGPTPDAQAHSFSYGPLSAAHQSVQAAIDDFVATKVLPNLP